MDANDAARKEIGHWVNPINNETKEHVNRLGSGLTPQHGTYPKQFQIISSHLNSRKHNIIIVGLGRES